MKRNEAQTRKDLVDPKLREAGWYEHQWQLELEYKITAGRIQFDGRRARRARPVYADYLLRYSSGKAIAVVEAKAEDRHYLEGGGQAKDYARKLGLWFAYSTNGHEIEFFNLKADTQTKVGCFHTPDELWGMYLAQSELKDCSDQSKKAILHEYYDESGIGQRRKLRYYQEKAVNNAVESIIHGKKRILVTMATGTGKTFTAIQLAYKLWSARVVKKILFIVDRNLLADQAFSDFEGAFPKDACYRLKPDERQWPKGRDLYFGIYQSLVGGLRDDDDEDGISDEIDRFKEFASDYFDLIVVDEAHRGARRSQDGRESSSWFRLLEHFGTAIQVGLTATPKRDESNDTYAHFGNPVVSYSLRDGIEDGYLAPYIIKRATTNIDALGYRPGSDNIEDVRGKILEVKDYFTPDFERKLSIPQRTRAFAYHLLRHLFSTDPVGKTIVFCVDQAHALDMAKYCKEAFMKYKEKYGLDDYKGEYAVRITGADKNNKGKYPDLEKFKDLDSYQPVVVTTSKLLTTGVDVKNVKNIVIFRNIGSMVEFKQVIGRGTRTYEAKDIRREKLGFFILEYANYSTHLFNDPEWDDAPLDIQDDGAIEVTECPPSSGQKDVVPVGDGEGDVGDGGIYEEQDDDEGESIRYRMGEEFLSGQVGIAAEDTAIVGPDGKPIGKDDFIVYQSESIKKKFSSFIDLKKSWRMPQGRKGFENDAPNLDVRTDILKTLFFERHGMRSVDILDVIGNLLYGENYLTKEERIEKAKALNPKAFDLGSGEQNRVVEDILSVYGDTEHEPLGFPTEFWQIPKMRKHGGFSGIRDILGGKEKIKIFVQALGDALYDENITA